MSDSAITARAEQIVAMLSVDERADMARKLGGASVQHAALTLAAWEKKTGTRTAKMKLVKALVKIGNVA